MMTPPRDVERPQVCYNVCRDPEGRVCHMPEASTSLHEEWKFLKPALWGRGEGSRATMKGRLWIAEQKMAIILEGINGKLTIAELCRRCLYPLP